MKTVPDQYYLRLFGLTMIRISKLTDYGIVVMTQFATVEAERFLTARELAQRTRVPLPTVSKVLKTLLAANLLSSHRGATGGYQLTRTPSQISVREIVEAFEGSLAMTDCSIGPDICAVESHCATRSNWQKINRVISSALSNVSLLDMSRPLILKKRQRRTASSIQFANAR
jgi:FeS assembly SUF system regulator